MARKYICLLNIFTRQTTSIVNLQEPVFFL